MNSPNTPRPGVLINTNINTNNINNNNLYVSPPSTVGSRNNNNNDEIEESNIIAIPKKNYYTKGVSNLTVKQYKKMIPNATIINVEDPSWYPHFTKDHYYTTNSETNAGFGYTYKRVKKMEKKRVKIEGEKNKIKTYYAKQSSITPKNFRKKIPSAKLINVEKFKLFTPGLYYETRDQRFAGFGFTFKELVKIEKEREERFIERYKSNLPLEGGRKKTRRHKEARKKRTTRRRA